MNVCARCREHKLELTDYSTPFEPIFKVVCRCHLLNDYVFRYIYLKDDTDINLPKLEGELSDDLWELARARLDLGWNGCAMLTEYLICDGGFERREETQGRTSVERHEN